jgi:hypothetical protein
MKRIFVSAITILTLLSCNNESEADTGTGNRTHDLNTPVESTGEAGHPHSAGDTTPTTNNNIYNVDSPASMSNVMDTGKSVGSQNVSPKAH